MLCLYPNTFGLPWVTRSNTHWHVAVVRYLGASKHGRVVAASPLLQFMCSMPGSVPAAWGSGVGAELGQTSHSQRGWLGLPRAITSVQRVHTIVWGLAYCTCSTEVVLLQLKLKAAFTLGLFCWTACDFNQTLFGYGPDMWQTNSNPSVALLGSAFRFCLLLWFWVWGFFFSPNYPNGPENMISKFNMGVSNF